MRPARFRRWVALRGQSSDNRRSMAFRAIRRAHWAVPLLLASAGALALAPLPLPRSTVVAPVAQPVNVAAAAAPAQPDLLASPQRWPHAAAPRSRSLVGERATRLSAALERARQTFGVYGAEIAASWQGSLAWTAATGVMRDARTPLAADQPLVIGSVTKTFTASLILQLAEEGLVSLDAPVSDYLPGEPRLAGITVRELLAHTSGLPDFYFPLAESLLKQPNRVWTPHEVLGRIGSAWFRPGTNWAYSNTNYVVLGLVAEAVTGESAADLLAERFSGPLGLEHTHLVTTDAGTLLGASWATSFWTAGAVSSTASDLVRWGDALYGGSVLRPASLQQMLAFGKDDYGLGARRMTLDKHHAFGHTGLLATYTAVLLHFPDDGVTVALLVNRSQVDLPAMLTAHIGGQPSLLDLILAE
jgi:D-alanyl-D-alanine carboxypeptidase